MVFSTHLIFRLFFEKLPLVSAAILSFFCCDFSFYCDKNPGIQPGFSLTGGGHPKIPHPYQVVCCGTESKEPVYFFLTGILGLSQPAHCFHPAENLFHPLAFSHTYRIPGVAGGPTIYRRAFLTLGNMRCNGQGTQNSDKITGIVSPYPLPG